MRTNLDPTLLAALITLATTVITILGGIATAWINNSRLDAKEKGLFTSMTNSAVAAVKATAQTLTSGARDGKGNLPGALATAAKQEALKQAKILLGSQRLAEAQEKYGITGVDEALSTLLESALHDAKNVKATTTSSTSIAIPSTDGSVATTTKQTSTSATETPPANP